MLKKDSSLMDPFAFPFECQFTILITFAASFSVIKTPRSSLFYTRFSWFSYPSSENMRFFPFRSRPSSELPSSRVKKLTKSSSERSPNSEMEKLLRKNCS